MSELNQTEENLPPLSQRLWELASLFLQLGFTAFGGPAAHIAMMEAEVVSKRKWLDRQHFLDLIGATNLIPGPNSTEMVMHVGLQRAGIPGMIVAGVCFIGPAALLTGLLAWFYVRFGTLPTVTPFLEGIKPVVLVLIFNAVLKLGRKAMKHPAYYLLGAIVVATVLLGTPEVLAILVGGIAGMIAIQAVKHRFQIGLWPLFGVFLKVGAVLFGSGYVLFAYLEGELVEQRGWLTQTQLLDAIAAGQFTPGPVLTTATFIGYQIAGLGGALVATLGIFLPSFVFVALVNPWIPRLRESAWLSAFLDAVNVSAIGVMVAVLLQLSYTSLLSPFQWQGWVILALAVGVSQLRPKISPMYLVVGGALLGYGLSFFA
ncbi:MAG: chromate transporter [Bacteroidia bacterium]